MEEHRVDLKRTLRRVWAPRDARPKAVVYPHYEWIHPSASVHPESGRTSFWITPTVNKEIFLSLLRASAEEQRVGKEKRIMLVLDNAGLDSL